MKKPALLLFLLIYGLLVYGQETVFLETCGNIDVSTPKKIDAYSGWDNSTPVTFSGTTTLDGVADVRKTASTTNHIWFPSAKSSDFIIANIPCANYHQLTLSFDMAAYKLTEANTDKLNLSYNDSAIILPSTTFPTTKFITVQNILLGNSSAATLHFSFTSENNINGYRLDNIKITGIRTISSLHNPSYRDFNPIVSGDKLLLSNLADGTPVEIYNCMSAKVQSSFVKAGFITLNTHLTTGLYIVRAGEYSGKILLFFQ